MRPRVCYVLPKYDPDSEEHFYHVYAFLEHLAATADIFLLVERATARPAIRLVRRVYRQRLGGPLRAVETLAAVIAARALGYRVFYVHYSYVGAVCASAVTRLAGGRVFYWNCGLPAMFFTPWALTRQALAGKFSIEIPLRLSLRAAHVLVTGTPRMAEYYTREFGVPQEKTVVLPNEIDLRRFAQVPSREAARTRLGLDDRPVALFVHRLSWRKGAELLPAILERVAAARDRVLLLVAGDGPSRRQVEARIAAADLADHVRFLGWVPNRRIADLYAAADLFIMPSMEEGFPRVLLEAMASGLPFVATDVGGVREMCAPEQQQWLVPAGDADRFAAAVLEALDDEGRRQTLAEVGRQHVRRYDLPVVAREFAARVLGQVA